VWNAKLRFASSWDRAGFPGRTAYKWGLRYLSYPNNGLARELSNVIMRHKTNLCDAKSWNRPLFCFKRENANRRALGRRWRRAIARAVPERVTGTERSDREWLLTSRALSTLLRLHYLANLSLPRALRTACRSSR